MKTQLELWLEKLNSDEKLTQELFEKKTQYNNDENGLKKFIEEVFVKEAKENGFDVSIEDILSYKDSFEIQELTPEMLEDVTGGSMRTQIAGIGAASLLFLAAPAIAKAAAIATPSADVSGISITQMTEQKDVTQPADILTQLREQSTTKALKASDSNSTQSQTQHKNTLQQSTKKTKSSMFQKLKAFWQNLTKPVETKKTPKQKILTLQPQKIPTNTTQLKLM